MNGKKAKRLRKVAEGLQTLKVRVQPTLWQRIKMFFRKLLFGERKEMGNSPKNVYRQLKAVWAPIHSRQQARKAFAK